MFINRRLVSPLKKMRRIAFLLFLFICACHATGHLVCDNTQHYEDDTRFSIELFPPGSDPSFYHLVHIELSMVWSPVMENLCPPRREDDRLQIAWSDLGVEFAQYPVKCGERHQLNFSVSTLGTKRWDNTVQAVTDGSVFMPQVGRESMMAIGSRLPNPVERVPIEFRFMSGSHAVLESLGVTVCYYDDQQDTTTVTESVPLLIPFHDCILKDQSGFCSTNFGYAASQSMVINETKHHDSNRFSPSRWHSNYWKVPTQFEPGYHPNQFHAQWPCFDGTHDPYRVHWHLNESLSTAEWSIGGSCRMTEGAHVVTTEEEDTMIAAYQETTFVIFVPYYSQYNPEFAHSSRKRGEEEQAWDESHDECFNGHCCSNCDGLWGLVVFGAFLLFVAGLVLLVGCIGPWWSYDSSITGYDHSHQMMYATHQYLMQAPRSGIPSIVAVDHPGYAQGGHAE